MSAGPATQKQAAVEIKRRTLLRSMGCDVKECPIGFTGILVDYPGDTATAVISSESGVVGEDFKYDTEIVRIYTIDDDLPVINSLGANLAEQINAETPLSPTTQFAIQPMPHNELFAALATVRHYERARFEICDLPLDTSLRVSQTRVKEFKLLQVSTLVEELTAAGIELFTPCRYLLPDGSTSIITPPVAEMTSQGPILIEGHTRAFYASQQGRRQLKAVLASQVQAALPVEPQPFLDLRISHETIKASDNMPGPRSLVDAQHRRGTAPLSSSRFWPDGCCHH